MRNSAPCEIPASLGAGGTGDADRARDPRLGREVAINILPDEVASDPDHPWRDDSRWTQVLVR